MDGLYAREAARWRTGLSWDTRSTWQIVEAGRRLGTAAGAVAIDDDGAPAGWCFGIVEGGGLQVGGFVAESDAATAALLTALERHADHARVRTWSWFGWFDAPGLCDALRRRGATPTRYLYLASPLGDVAPALLGDAPQVRAWSDADASLVPSLLAASYLPDADRPFAPASALPEWAQYVTSLVEAQGCGVFAPDLSVLAGSAATGLDGAALVSRIAPETAHLVQLTVSRTAQGRGLGRQLLRAARARAAAAGCRTMTLLVHEENAPARRLYERAGFGRESAFLWLGPSAVHPRTSSSDALPIGGVSTRR